MSRSVRDLRSIINASRLSMQEEHSSDEYSTGSDNDQVCKGSDEDLDDLLHYIDNRPSSALAESNFQSLSGRSNSSMRKHLNKGHMESTTTADINRNYDKKKTNLASSILQLGKFPRKYVPVPPIGSCSSPHPSDQSRNSKVDTISCRNLVANEMLLDNCSYREMIECLDSYDRKEDSNGERFVSNQQLCVSHQIEVFDELFEFLDGTIIGSWLESCNNVLNYLSSYLKYHFVDLAHFFFTKLSYTKYVELLDLEYSIVLDHLKCAFHSGFSQGKISESDLETLSQAVLKEYPVELKKHDLGTRLLLDIILTFCDNKTDAYHKLLNGVICLPTDKKSVHWLLAIRVFSLLSFISGILKFYESIVDIKELSTNDKLYEGMELRLNINQLVIQAVQHDYVDVLKYFSANHKIDFSLILDGRKKNLVCVATTGKSYNALKYLLSLQVSAEERSENGNTPLQSAVTYDDLKLASILLEHGVDVNASNGQADGATALHMAVLLGNFDMVRLLLKHDANEGIVMDSPTKTTALTLAQDMNLMEIVGLFLRIST